MSSICEQIRDNLGVHDYTLLQQHYPIPCGAWSLESQNNMLDPFFSPHHRGVQYRKWLTHIFQTSPWLVSKDQEALDFLLTLADNLTIEQAFYFSFLVLEMGAKDFPLMSISRISVTPFHNTHRTYRNEYWTLYMELTESGLSPGYILFRIWRHTLLPETVWDSDRSDMDFSYIQITWTGVLPGTTMVQQEQSVIVPESWKLCSITDEPFRLTYGANYIRSVSGDTVFPVEGLWTFQHKVLQFHLDNVKPLFMTRSNGCVTCNDGIGLKKYTYPSLSGLCNHSPVRGMFDHAWESGVSPEGYSSSTMLRSIIHIEKHMYPLTRPDNWLYLFVHTEDQYQIGCYFFSSPTLIHHTYHPDLLTISKPDGTVWSPKPLWVDVVRPDSQTILLSFSNHFNLQLHVPYEQSHIPYTPGAVQQWGGLVRGTTQWNQESETPVQGIGFIEMTDSHSYQERADAILSLFPADKAKAFKTWSRYQNYFDNTSNGSDRNASYLLWLLPVLSIMIVLVVIASLLWSRQYHTRQPWIRAQDTFWGPSKK